MLRQSKMNRIVQRIVLTFLIAVLPIIAVAAARSSSSKPVKPKAPEKHETVISALTPNSVTVTQDNQTKTYQVSQLTEVTVNGQRATLADLKNGMTVSVVLTDQTRASRITAMTK